MNTVDKVYLDYAATTPADPRVVDVMLPYFTQIFGNPSSIHHFGQQAENDLDQARMVVAEALHARPGEIIFTSGGTESDNLAIQGTAFAERKNRNANHILVSPVEHNAVLSTAQMLSARFGFELDYLPVDEYGRVDPRDVAACIRPDTAVVSTIYANNEIGTINSIAEIGAICREKGVPFHTDAVQAAAHLKMDVVRAHVDLLSIGAHKFYGPKGVGALYIRRGTPIDPIQLGGKQEAAMRAGTHNIPYIVGMAEALRIAQSDIEERHFQFSAMRDWLVDRVLHEIPRTKLSGHPQQRLPNHASFVFDGVDGSALLAVLDVAGYACSSGSACKVGTPEASEVLTAIGFPKSWALGSLRVTIGKGTTQEHLEGLMKVLPQAISRSRSVE